MVEFDQQKKRVEIYKQNLWGKKTDDLTVPIAEVVTIDVEKHTSNSLEERSGRSEPVVSHSYHLVMRMREGYAIPLTSGGCSHSQAKQTQQAIAQRINQFLRAGI
ncbi:MAG: hypothetical protein WBG32_21725 [Nodosilinea sp.]